MLKIAIPLANDQLCMHFGHCEEFAVIDADENEKKIVKIEKLTPPPHEPGVLPRWIASLGVQIVIAGGMGGRALQLLSEQGVEVLAGAPSLAPEKLVEAFFAKTLELGVNGCNHEEGHGHGEGHCHGHGEGHCHGHAAE